MQRSQSRLAQFTFDVRGRVLRLATSSSAPVSLGARAANKLVFALLLKRAGAGRLVSAEIYGRTMTIPAEHPLPAILTFTPQYNRGLGLAAKVVAAASAPGSPLAMIDVGANIGETAAIVESHAPGRYRCLCVEPDADLAELCRLNHRANPRVQVTRSFVGEREGAKVRLQDDGRANPATVLAEGPGEGSEAEGKLLRLDTIAGEFAEQHGGIDLIKVDTEGYDFSVLRSADNLLKSYHPALFFEWFPAFLSGLGESVCGGFAYLAELKYRHFVFFASCGNYYCRASDPDELFLRSLSAVALADPSIQYFDVFASTDAGVCDALVEESIRALGTGEPGKQPVAMRRAAGECSGDARKTA